MTDDIRLPDGIVLVLRTCTADLRGTHDKGSHFVWPSSGHVACDDWDPTPKCGGGLHGLLWGEGDPQCLSWAESATWLIVAVKATDIVEIVNDGGHKVKFPHGDVVCCGTRFEATSYLVARAPGRRVHGALITAGDGGTATAGYQGTATAGDRGTATAGYQGTATAGHLGTATAGDQGTATAGDLGTATAGDQGTATAGDGGTATAGDRGTVQLRHWDAQAGRYRIVTGYVGEDGIESGKRYRCDNNGKLVFVDEPAKGKEQP
jgi:hypothetical protein